MEILRLLLLPLAFLYGLIIRIRNGLFDIGIIKQTSFPLPVISVGNLTTGGTGKTPHIEYLIRLLSPGMKVATLSRGYGRKTRGFRQAEYGDNASGVGDEPMQYLMKFPDIAVFVDESRKRGIRKLLKKQPGTEVVLLDDAYQHRYVKPGFSILLTDYLNPYPGNYLLPAGSLREPISGAKRADAIIVTKSPRVFSPIDYRIMLDELKPLPHQKVYFSYIEYGKITPLWDEMPEPEENHKYSNILLFAGIANIYPIQEYLSDFCFELTTIEFKDHYRYKTSDLRRIKENFNDLYSRNKMLVTTEKDAMRLMVPEIYELARELPLHYLPIEVKFHRQFKESFNEIILNYVEKNKRKR
ncbi:Tetraacyldisaccharide 4'-kinase [anaerobic digester metagenome]